MDLGVLGIALGCLSALGLALWARSVMRRGARAYERERARRRAARPIEPLEPAPPPAPSPPPEVRVEKIIERQVLVMRCRYCGKLTPVDLEACAECGAKP